MFTSYLLALIATAEVARTSPANITSMNIAKVATSTVVVTAYTLSKDETDDTPCIGAGNHNLCELSKTTKVCASNMFPLHTKIYIEGIGECEILDRMNRRYKNRVDVLFDTKQKAINFGKQTKQIIIK